MPIDPEKSWTDSIDKLEPTKSPSEGIQKLADAIDAAVTTKAQLTSIQGSVTFTFQKAAFQGAMLQAAAAKGGANPAQIATAWAQAITSSTMVVAPGAIMGAPAPVTTFSVVTATVLDPPSLTAAQNFLQGELSASKPEKGKDDGKLGPTFRSAFLMLTYTINGLDSTPTPAGPLPLIAPALALM